MTDESGATCLPVRLPCAVDQFKSFGQQGKWEEVDNSITEDTPQDAIIKRLKTLLQQEFSEPPQT